MRSSRRPCPSASATRVCPSVHRPRLTQHTHAWGARKTETQSPDNFLVAAAASESGERSERCTTTTAERNCPGRGEERKEARRGGEGKRGDGAAAGLHTFIPRPRPPVRSSAALPQDEKAKLPPSACVVVVADGPIRVGPYRLAAFCNRDTKARLARSLSRFTVL